MSQSLSIDTSELDGFEGLHNAVQGSHVEVVQLERGRLCGSVTHLGMAQVSLSIGSFNLGVRTQRTPRDHKLIIGMLLDARDRVSHWSYDMRPADVLVIPPLVEHDGVFHGSSSYAALRIDICDLAAIYGGEPRLNDPETWLKQDCFRAHDAVGMAAARRLPQIVANVIEQKDALSDAAVEYWKRAIMDCMTATIINPLALDDSGRLPSALSVVRQAEYYLDSADGRPVHIAEICASLRLSRRALHRAFHEVFGIGPVTFLRRKRLCAVYSNLRNSAPGQTTVAKAALEQGFSELGRFAGWYRLMFGEYPSQTLGCAR